LLHEKSENYRISHLSYTQRSYCILNKKSDETFIPKKNRAFVSVVAAFSSRKIDLLLGDCKIIDFFELVSKMLTCQNIQDFLLTKMNGK